VIGVYETLNAAPCPTAKLAGSVCDHRFRFANGNAVPPVTILDRVFDKTLTNALTGEDFFAYQGVNYRVRINAFWQDGYIMGAFYSTEQDDDDSVS
jgi:hypothetical protein